MEGKIIFFPPSLYRFILRIVAVSLSVLGSRTVHSVDERRVLDICIPVINNLSTNSSLSEKEGL
jgi:hypothetical protein